MITKLILVTLAWFSAGLVLLGGMLPVETLRATAAGILRTMVSAAMIAALVLGGFYLGEAYLVAGLVLVAARVGWEAAAVLGIFPRLAGLVLGVAATGIAVFESVEWGKYLAGALGGAWLCSAVAGFGVGRTRYAQWLFFPALPLLLLIQATTNELGKQMVLFAFLITEAFDSLALVTGKLVGKTPLVPAISPNKTWEGLAGGVAITLVLVAGVALYLQIDISKAAVTATVAIICAIVGDLTGSGMKRRAGVKDFPVVHERQGGLLDIFDAWIVAGAVLGGFSIFLAAT